MDSKLNFEINNDLTRSKTLLRASQLKLYMKELDLGVVVIIWKAICRSIVDYSWGTIKCNLKKAM